MLQLVRIIHARYFCISIAYFAESCVIVKIDNFSLLLKEIC
jgi:hypothetical protein